jgi:hypothetical protein
MAKNSRILAFIRDMSRVRIDMSRVRIDMSIIRADISIE